MNVHSNGLTIDEASLIISLGAIPIPILDVAYDFEREFFTVHFDAAVSGPAIPLTISLIYTGVILTGVAEKLSAGFYLDSYVDFVTKETRELAATQFETI